MYLVRMSMHSTQLFLRAQVPGKGLRVKLGNRLLTECEQIGIIRKHFLLEVRSHDPRVGFSLGTAAMVLQDMCESNVVFPRVGSCGVLGPELDTQRFDLGVHALQPFLRPMFRNTGQWKMWSQEERQGLDVHLILVLDGLDGAVEPRLPHPAPRSEKVRDDLDVNPRLASRRR